MADKQSVEALAGRSASSIASFPNLFLDERGLTLRTLSKALSVPVALLQCYPEELRNGSVHVVSTLEMSYDSFLRWREPRWQVPFLKSNRVGSYSSYQIVCSAMLGKARWSTMYASAEAIRVGDLENIWHAMHKGLDGWEWMYVRCVDEVEIGTFVAGQTRRELAIRVAQRCREAGLPYGELAIRDGSVTIQCSGGFERHPDLRSAS